MVKLVFMERDYETEAKNLGWRKNSIGKWVNPRFKYAAVIRAQHAVEDHADWEKSILR